MSGGWGITFRHGFAIPLISSARYPLLSRTQTTAAWFITEVGVRAISDVLPTVTSSFYRQCGLRKGYWNVYVHLPLLPSSTVRNSARCAPRMIQWGKGRADPRSTYNLCLILKIKLQNHFIYFFIHGPVHRETNLIIFQQDANYSVYYISVNSSTCFGCWHP